MSEREFDKKNNISNKRVKEIQRKKFFIVVVMDIKIQLQSFITKTRKQKQLLGKCKNKSKQISDKII